MSLSVAIYTVLRLNADVVKSFATRIYPVIVPQDSTLPAITYQVVSHEETNTQTTANKFDRIGIRIAINANKYSEAEECAGYVYTAMSRYVGTVDNEKILTIRYDSQSDDVNEIFSNSSSTTGVMVFIKYLDFTIFRG